MAGRREDPGQVTICLLCHGDAARDHLLEALPDGRRLLWCYADRAGVKVATDVTDDVRFGA